MGESDRRRSSDAQWRLGQRERARRAVAARAGDAADLARLLDMLALWPGLDADAGAGWAGMDLADFNDSV
ncbi:hypothetical protein [Streptomyces sp. NPDC097981]|uniref:hypothetical protein n=1 Tax=Streptomyces sp. NPDC097981 TaxID=3155428 RepID=UPI003332ECAF